MTTATRDVSTMAEPLSGRAREVLAMHGDPRRGSDYWLEFQNSHDVRLGELETWDELFVLPPADANSLRTRPVEDFVPRALFSSRDRWVVAQTGGATGRPATTCYMPEDFEAAFVLPFVAAAERHNFPRGGGWLFVGPTGPHIIGRAADELARRMRAPGIFTVDFDPRWFRRMADGSMGRRRYVEHIVAQAMDVIDQQEVTVLFATPPTLAALAGRMTERQRLAVRGVHYGGTALTAESLARFQNELFPAAVHLSGYGNTLFGCALELSIEADRTPTYFPHGDRLRFALSEDGRVRFCRVDAAFLVLNQIERDAASLVAPPRDWCDAGFVAAGLANPQPAPGPGQKDQSQGIY